MKSCDPKVAISAAEEIIKGKDHFQQMAVFAQAKSLSTGRKIYYGVIDGEDSARIVAGYPKAFKGGRRK